MGTLTRLPLGIYEKGISNLLSWEEKLLVAKRAGFDCLEMGIDGTPERLARLYEPAFPREVRAAAANIGVPIYTMALTANRAYPLGSEDSAIRIKGLELVERAVALAAECGIAKVHLAGYDELGDRANLTTKALFRESIERVAAVAEDSPVIVAIETMDTPFMGSCTEILRLCRDIAANKLRCYADIGNMTSLGLNVAEELRVGGEYITGVHLKDATVGVCRDVPFGKGIVDFDAAIETLRDMGYSGSLTAETWSYDRISFHPYLKTISSFLREKLNKY